MDYYPSYLHPVIQMTPASLEAVANWNAERGCALYRQSVHEKNHDRLSVMLRDFARHMHNADYCRRQAYLLEHKRRH